MKYAAALLIALAVPSFAAERVALPPDVIPEHYDVAITPDAATARFSGSETVEIAVKRETSEIVLNAAELTFSRVALSSRAEAPAISLDAATETATFKFAQPIAPGTYTLTIDYAGKINSNAAGLFYLDYDGGKKRALFTQFENSDARRFLPCWDEPARKATFTLTATVPASQTAVSNMPAAGEESVAGGLKRVKFMPSPKMSSYLLFFGLGDFERISQKVNGVDVGIVVTRGNTGRAQYALDSAVQILPYYEDYFGVKYPLPKLDIIAGPGQSQFFGAMENWGAIFSFDRAVLIDPSLSTQGDRIGVYLTNAHEMAHMWFGDLVTMDWWDGLWLNEGFASWMDTKEGARFHPEWNLWLGSLDSKEAAMAIDARDGTHPVVQPIIDVLQASQAFDAITYQKGMSVIRMLEDYTGEDTWRAGVRAYVKAHAYGNTVTDDLWSELDKVSATPMSSIAHDFTLQPGVPLIRVASTRKGIRLSQDQFTANGPGGGALAWQVPVVEKPLGSHRAWHGIVSRDKPAEIALPKHALPIVNAGQAGYFRTLYDKKLAARLAARFTALSAADQLGILNDAAALGYAGYEPMGDFLRLASKARPGMNPTMLSAIADRLRSLDRSYRGLPGRTAYRAFALRVLRPLFASMGWTGKPGEGPNDARLRHDLLAALSQLDAPEIAMQARQRFAGFVADTSSLSGDLRSNVLAIAAAHADPATWEQLHTLARTAKNSLEQRQLYLLLATAQDSGLAQRALALSLSDEAPATLKLAIIARVAGDPRHGHGDGDNAEVAFEFALTHAGEIDALLEPSSRTEYIPSLAGQTAELSGITKLRAYAEANIPASARQSVVKAEAAITYAAMIRAKRLPEVDHWLKRGRGKRH
jgi:aminopeptidase N